LAGRDATSRRPKNNNAAKSGHADRCGIIVFKTEWLGSWYLPGSLAAAFSGQSLLEAFSFAGFQIKRMLLDILDDVLLLDLSFETTKSTL
jgi:hypothetical protein